MVIMYRESLTKIHDLTWTFHGHINCSMATLITPGNQSKYMASYQHASPLSPTPALSNPIWTLAGSRGFQAPPLFWLVSTLQGTLNSNLKPCEYPLALQTRPDSRGDLLVHCWVPGEEWQVHVRVGRPFYLAILDSGFDDRRQS